MKVILIGYPGSQKIVKASTYLFNKYMPLWISRFYFNYKGGTEGWSSFVAGILSTLDDRDDFIILSLDDYLISEKLNIDQYNNAYDTIWNDNSIACVKLCESTEQEHLEYPVTTQYCIWNKEVLVELLSKTTSPWDFEINGSKIFIELGGKSLHIPCIKYFTNSSISSRWEGVRLDGLSEEDKTFLKVNHYVE